MTMPGFKGRKVAKVCQVAWSWWRSQRWAGSCSTAGTHHIDGDRGIGTGKASTCRSMASA